MLPARYWSPVARATSSASRAVSAASPNRPRSAYTPASVFRAQRIAALRHFTSLGGQRQGLVEIRQFRVGHDPDRRQVQKGRDILRIELDRPLVVRNRLFRFALTEQRVPAVVVGDGGRPAPDARPRQAGPRIRRTWPFSSKIMPSVEWASRQSGLLLQRLAAVLGQPRRASVPCAAARPDGHGLRRGPAGDRGLSRVGISPRRCCPGWPGLLPVAAAARYLPG